MATDRRFTAPAPRSEPPLAGPARVGSHAPGRLSGRSRPSPHSGRSPAPSRRLPVPARPEVGDDVERFADRALRLVLEVVDRRRPPRQLTEVLAPSMLGMVGAAANASTRNRRLGTAVLHRVHVTSVEYGRTGAIRGRGRAAAEVFATYARGDHVFAIAARAEETRHGWIITALRLS